MTARHAASQDPKTTSRLRQGAFFKQLGPGLITGAADDDPSGIATYSQAGAQFGANMLWTMVLTYPLMTAVQLISAQIGRVTGCGLASNIGKVLPRPAVLTLVGLLFVANTINIGSDLAAMGDATKLAVGGSEHVYTVLFAFPDHRCAIWVDQLSLYVSLWGPIRCDITRLTMDRGRLWHKCYPFVRPA